MQLHARAALSALLVMGSGLGGAMAAEAGNASGVKAKASTANNAAVETNNITIPANASKASAVASPRSAHRSAGKGPRRGNDTLVHVDGWTKGDMTMWSTERDVLIGSSCEYANSKLGGMRSPPVLDSPYIRRGSYCAVDARLYGQGHACGSCFKIAYDGTPGTDPARPGSHIVKVVDSGSAMTFDCQLEAFRHITGSHTGIFDIWYKPVPCQTSGRGPRATVIDAGHYMYGRVIFSDFPRAVSWAEMYIGSKRFRLARNFGTWRANTDGRRGRASFKVGLMGGGGAWFGDCLSWPLRRGATCRTHRWSSSGAFWSEGGERLDGDGSNGTAAVEVGGQPTTAQGAAGVEATKAGEGQPKAAQGAAQGAAAADIGSGQANSAQGSESSKSTAGVSSASAAEAEAAQENESGKSTEGVGSAGAMAAKAGGGPPKASSQGTAEAAKEEQPRTFYP